MTQDEVIITHGTNVSYTKQMYNTRNEYMLHVTNVSYTERMYHTRNKCIIHGMNVSYTEQMYSYVLYTDTVCFVFCHHFVENLG